MIGTIDALVVGAGVVGLAVARELARDGQEVLVVESGDRIGAETSSRNSEVIHAGIYYPPGSLKARLCVEGRALLYAFCEEFSVPHKRIGKFIVATDEAEQAKLQSIVEIARRNGVDDLAIVTGDEVRREEPEVSCVSAILSPSTGIVDSSALMLALQGDVETHGGAVALRTTFEAAAGESGGAFRASLRSEGDVLELACHTIINAAGHGAHKVAAGVEGLPHASLPARFLAKGSYCSVSGRSPFRHLIYPVPVPGALGTHVTLDMNGGLRLGPDIAWVDEVDYRVSDEITETFRQSCRKFWPGVEGRELTASYCGIRPKIHGPTVGFADFRIDGPDHHGVSGLVNLFGVESPGLTSSLAIARQVRAMLGERVPLPA